MATSKRTSGDPPQAAPIPVELRLLGPLEALQGSETVQLGGGKQRALLAVLGLHAGRTVSTARLVDELWGEDVPETAVKMVQIYVSQLRKALPPGILRTRPPGYVLELDPERIDVHRFERLLRSGREARTAGDHERASTLLREALALWRGPALAEFDEPFAAAEWPRLAELEVACLEERIDADLALGRHADLAGELETLVARYPLRERLRGQQMLAFYRSGRQADALAAYQGFRRTLDEELGIEPSAALRELERRILQQDPELDVAAGPPAPAVEAPAPVVEAPVPTLGRPPSVAEPRPPAPPVQTRSPFVARHAELGRLQGHLEEALRAERQLVFVTGEMGIGKTTLVETFVARTEVADLLVLRGQCVEQHGPGEPYMPVLEALGGIRREPDAELLVARLAEHAPTWVAQIPWLVSPAELEAVRSRALGATRDRMLREIVEGLEALAAERPVLVVLDDLQWSDHSTVDLLGAVARRRLPARLFVVGTYRPADARTRANPVHDLAQELRLRGLCVELPLPALGPRDAAEYVAARLPALQLPPEAFENLLARTRGSPLFLKKVVDAWIESGLAAGDGLERLVGDLPETVLQLVEQEVRRLPEADQRLLEAASVLGYEFPDALVVAAAGLPPGDVEARCEDLARAGVYIVAHGEERWPDGTVAGRYAFAHDVCREVLYARLPPGGRARLHRAAGTRLAEAYAGDTRAVAGELAQHFVRAGDARQAVRFLREAAERAAERRAPKEAIEHVTSALALLGELPDGRDRAASELGLRTVLGTALIATEGWSSREAEAELLRARDLAEGLGRNELGWVLFLLATFYETQGRYERSEALLEETLSLVEGGGVLADSHEVLACSLFHQGAFEASLEHAERGLAVMEPGHTNPVAATYGDNASVSCHAWAALSLWFLGYADQARERAAQAVALAEDPRRSHGLATALAQAAVVAQLRGEPQEAERWAEASRESAARDGYAYRHAMATVLRGWAVAARGAPEEGVGELRRGLDLSRATGARMDDSYYLGLLADACLRAGRHAEGLAAVAAGLEGAPRGGRFFYRAELHRLRGEILAATGKHAEARAALEQALEEARSQGSPALELRAAVGLARLLADGGETDAARMLVAPVYGRCTEGFDTPDLREAAALLGRLGEASRTRTAPTPAPHPTPRHLPPPRRLLGRDPELGRLRGALAAALDGEAQVVFVSGEAGIGKTTLVEAFLAEVGRDELVVARGQCVEQRGPGEAYMPVLDALGRICREAGGAPVAELLTQRAPSWFDQLPSLHPGKPAAAASTGPSATPPRMLRELLEALEAIGSHTPLVLVLEDLHWSDPSTLELVAAVARRREPSRLLVVGTYRPGETRVAEAGLDPLAQELRLRGHAEEIRLRPLAGDALAGYLDGRFPRNDFPPALVEALARLTGGNPLFVENVVDAWVEQGSLAELNGGWTLREEPERLASGIPESLRLLIERTLDALDPADVALLEAASVAGREFSAALLAGAAGKPEDEIETRASALVRAGRFLETREPVEWPDGTIADAYAFRHDLYQEVIYARLPAGRRARLHARAGERLERAFGARALEIAPELAAHFVRARDAVRAIEYLGQAAERALRRGAYQEAIDQLTRALAFLERQEESRTRDERELALRVGLGNALVAARGHAAPEVRDVYAKAWELCERLGAGAEALPVLYGRWLTTCFSGRPDEALAAGEEFLRRAEELDDPAALVAHRTIGEALFVLGRFAEAREHFEEVVARYDADLHRPLGFRYHIDPGTEALAISGWTLWFLGFPEQASQRAEQAVLLALRLDHPFALCESLSESAMLYQFRRDTELVRERAESATALMSEHGLPLPSAWTAVLHGWAVAELDDPERGIREIEEGLAAAAETGASWSHSYFLALLAEARRKTGRTADALRALDEALEAAAAMRERFWEAEIHRLRGELLREGATREPDTAEDELRLALAIAKDQGARSLELRAAVSLARLLEERGARQEARELLSAARSGLHEGSGTADVLAADDLLRKLGAHPEPLPGAPPEPSAASAGTAAPGVAGPRPATRYARTADGLSIAYQVTGSGPLDLVLVPGFVSHLDRDWNEPRHARFLERLASFSRLVRFDKRGTGLSDRPEGVPDLETRMDDVRAVMDAASSERAVLLGYSEGGPMSVLFAATHPERVRGLVLVGAYAKRVGPEDDYPWAPTREQRDAHIEHVLGEWGFEAQMRYLCPSADEALERWWGERCRAAASPGAVRALLEMNSQIDVRDLLPAVHVPTLVVHRTGDHAVRLEEGRYIADRIPGARFVELAGDDHWVGWEPDEILDVVAPFVAELGGAVAPEADSDRVLATILVSDIVGSTGHAVRLGDRAWADLLAQHEAAVREELGRFRGEEVDAAGDGFLALFDGPARAIRCGLTLSRRLSALGLQVRVGVHTGEIERRGRLARGIAVHLAARVSAEAKPGEVLVTATTRDLVAGSELAFADRGERALKGFEEPRRLYAAVA